MAMVTDPDYKEIVKHRTAAVEDSRLIRLAPSHPNAAICGEDGTGSPSPR